MLKNYPGTYGIFSDDMTGKIGTVETVNYEKRGSRWIETGRKTQDLTPVFYCNSIDAVPFFRGLGGYERLEMRYTYYGYIPGTVNSISPDRKNKTVRRFRFER
jgi:hypothetical protein